MDSTSSSCELPIVFSSQMLSSVRSTSYFKLSKPSTKGLGLQKRLKCPSHVKLLTLPHKRHTTAKLIRTTAQRRTYNDGLQRMWKLALNDECKTTQLSAGVDLITLPPDADWPAGHRQQHLFARKCIRDIFDKMMDWNQNGDYKGCVLIGNPGIGNLLTDQQANSPFRQQLVSLLLFISLGQRIEQECFL